MINTSIIIRTKNEERWINNCLSMVFSQTHKNFEVIVVDNNSSDNTLKIVKNFPVKKIIKIKKFYPGLALDKGIRVSKGRFLVFLSSHCIPTDKNWLKNLLKNFKNKKIVGVYGKQLPLPFTDSQDKRDLLLTFGKDRKIQKKDYFFHNANSAILKSIYIKFPFDLRVKNMEDRIWAKQVIDSNYNLCYEPKAGVYHYHGLHHKNNFNRLKGVSTIINSVDKEELNYLPDFMKPKNLKLITVIPLLKRKKLSIKEIDHINKLLKTLLSSEFINNVYFITRSTHKFLKDKRIKIIKTSKKVVTHNLDELLKFSLNLIENRGNTPEAILYVNYEYLFRPKNYYDELINHFQKNNYNSVFGAIRDYKALWYLNSDNEYKAIKKPTHISSKVPNFIAVYGLGLISRVNIIRSGNLFENQIGIIPIDNFQYSLRISDKQNIKLKDHPDI